MRTLSALALALLVLVPLAQSAAADEVVLVSGSVIRGTVESETETEVVVRTEIGLMKFGKSLVAKIRRSLADPSHAAAPSKRGLVLDWQVEEVVPEVRPAVTGAMVILARRQGGVVAVDAVGGKPLWTSDTGGNQVVGLAADPGGVYVASAEGVVARLGVANGERMWSARLAGPVSGAPLLHRRRLFLYGPAQGLYAVETASGKVRGLLGMRTRLSTPLASNGSVILAGGGERRLFTFSADGSELTHELIVPEEIAGNDLVLSLRTLVLGGEQELVILDPDRGEIVRRTTIPGLTRAPLAADPSRAYVELEGALTAVETLTGRVMWRAEDAGRIVAATVDSSSLYATTGEDTLVMVSLSNGSLRSSVPIGATPAQPPVVVKYTAVPPRSGEWTAVVLAHDGVCRGFVEGSVGPGVEPPVPAAAAATARGTRRGRVVHSPEGFMLWIPDGWSFSPEVTVGPVVVGLRPIPDAPRFLMSDARDSDRRVLALTSYMAVLLSESPARESKILGEAYLREERTAAAEGRFQIVDAKVGPVKLGGRNWTEVRLTHLLTGDGREIRIRKRALVSNFGEGRWIWLEMKVPELYAATVEADFEEVAVGFDREARDWSPTEEVVVTERVIAALVKGDVKGALRDVTAPMHRPGREQALSLEGRRVVLVHRGSRAVGSFREVLIRIDEPRGTRHASVLLGREGGRWLIVDWGSLFR